MEFLILLVLCFIGVPYKKSVLSKQHFLIFLKTILRNYFPFLIFFKLYVFPFKTLFLTIVSTFSVKFREPVVWEGHFLKIFSEILFFTGMMAMLLSFWEIDLFKSHINLITVLWNLGLIYALLKSVILSNFIIYCKLPVKEWHSIKTFLRGFLFIIWAQALWKIQNFIKT